MYHTSNFRISRDSYAAGLYGICNHLKYEQRIDLMIYEHLRILWPQDETSHFREPSRRMKETIR
jgi:hypothetical protein